MSGTSDRTFVDTNVLIYAHDVDAGRKHDVAKDLLRPEQAGKYQVELHPGMLTHMLPIVTNGMMKRGF